MSNVAILLRQQQRERLDGMTPAAGRRSAEQARALVRKGVASWSGGKPKGLARAPRPRGGLVSDAVIEDRR